MNSACQSVGIDLSCEFPSSQFSPQGARKHSWQASRTQRVSILYMPSHWAWRRPHHLAYVDVVMMPLVLSCSWIPNFREGVSVRPLPRRAQQGNWFWKPQPSQIAWQWIICTARYRNTCMIWHPNDPCRNTGWRSPYLLCNWSLLWSVDVSWPGLAQTMKSGPVRKRRHSESGADMGEMYL